MPRLENVEQHTGKALHDIITDGYYESGLGSIGVASTVGENLTYFSTWTNPLELSVSCLPRTPRTSYVGRSGVHVIVRVPS